MTDSKEPKIICRDICKVFGTAPGKAIELAGQGAARAEILRATGCIVALRDISFEIADGETFVIMGLSGSGKSTLIRHLNRLVEPTSGALIIGGEDVLAMNASRLRDFRRHRISMVFQNFGLLPHRTVLDNVAYPLLMQGRPRREQRDRAAHWIAQVGLGGYELHFPRQLSGGMKQRVGLARALAGEAEILLMDEAFSALDPLIRSEMQDQLAALQKQLGKTVVFITHDPDEAMLLGNRIAILREGMIQQIGSPEDILMRPANDYIARFVKSANRSRVLGVEPQAGEPVRREAR